MPVTGSAATYPARLLRSNGSRWALAGRRRIGAQRRALAVEQRIRLRGAIFGLEPKPTLERRAARTNRYFRASTPQVIAGEAVLEAAGHALKAERAGDDHPAQSLPSNQRRVCLIHPEAYSCPVLRFFQTGRGQLGTIGTPCRWGTTGRLIRSIAPQSEDILRRHAVWSDRLHAMRFRRNFVEEGLWNQDICESHGRF